MPVEPGVLALLVAFVAVGAFVNGLIGFGFALVAVNMLASALGAKHGVVVMSLLSPGMSAYQLWHNRDYSAVSSRLRSLLVGAMVGSFIGAQLLVILPGWIISLALGLLTAEFVIETVRHERPPLTATVERRLAPLVGLTSGMVNGALGASGPVAGSYLIAIGLRGREFVFGVSLVFLLQGLVRGATFLTLGQYTWSLLVAALALVVPSFVGQRVGFVFQGRLNPRLFQRIILLVLLFSSANMLLAGVRGLLAPF